MTSHELSQYTHEMDMHDAQHGSLSVMWDPGWTALVSKPNTHPKLTKSSLIVSPSGTKGHEQW